VTLEWGLKQSFRAYVEGAGGSIEIGEGTSRTSDGAFVFAAAPGDTGLTIGADGKPEGTGRFIGEVRCEAHGGMLKVFLADPAVEIGTQGGVLTVAESPGRDSRVALAVLDLDAATTGADGALVIPAKVSMDGWRVLPDHYPPMTPLDPVRLTLASR
jgi:hypothetical protein